MPRVPSVRALHSRIIFGEKTSESGRWLCQQASVCIPVWSESGLPGRRGFDLS